MGQIFNISASLPFLESLASGVKSRFAEPQKATILLPTKRAVPQLRSLFGRPPHIEALGEMEGAAPQNAISKLARIMGISKIIRAKNPKLDIAQSTRLAKSLVSLLDEMQVKNIHFTALKNIVPFEFAEHWQHTYNLLQEILREWQEFLRERNLLEPIEVRNADFIRQIEQLRANPPRNPFIIAGTTGTVQMTLELIKTVNHSQNGMIVLYGLDRNLTDENFKNLPETHPQFLLARMLDFLQIAPSSVEEWQEVPQTLRQNLISYSLFPAERIEEWQNFKPETKGLTILECRNAEEESAAVCEILRAAAAENKSAMVVTNDRDLAKRIKSKIFPLPVNDSSGKNILNLPVVNFLIRIAELGVEQNSPIKILSAFKHALVADEIKDKIREIEILHMRGITKENFRIAEYLEIIGLPEFLKIFAVKRILFLTLLEAHLQLAENIVGTEAFTEITDFIAELKTLAKTFEEIDPLSYPQLLKSIFSNEVRWPEYSADAKINIFSFIEARLQMADICVLAGMNEGNMPMLPEPDLFLNQQMRRTLGLDLPSIRIGQQAHDFEILSQTPRVFYTRSLKENGAPSVSSRLLQSLTTIAPQIDKGEKYIKAAKEFVTPSRVSPCERPQPKPPISSRPHKFSATKISKLMRDPYWVYASEILHLKKLELLDAPITAREFGNFIHSALNKFNKIYDGKIETLLLCGEDVLLEMGNIKEFKKFWWPRFERICSELIKVEHERRMAGAEVKSEIGGASNFGKFEVYARADRLEIFPQGINVIDYKTGEAPSQKNIDAGIDSQLAVEGIIFSEKFAKPVNAFEYWSVKGRTNDEFRIQTRSADLPNVKIKITELLQKFHEEETAFAATPRPSYALEYNDFEHLARNKEWEQ